MYFAKIIASDNDDLVGYSKLIPMDAFVGFVDSDDFFAKQHVTYKIYTDSDSNDGEADPVYTGKYVKDAETIEADVQSKLETLRQTGENLDDLNLVAEAFGIPQFSEVVTREANPTRAAPKHPWWRQKRVIIILSMILVLVVGGIAVYGTTVMSGATTQQVAKPTQTQLLDKGDYAGLAKYYPKKFQSVENEMVDKKSVAGLEMLKKQLPKNRDVTFDAAFVKRDWASVIKASNYQLDQVHKARLAVAYIYDGQPEAALTLNGELQSKTLSQLIFLTLVHQAQFDQAEQLGKSLNANDVKKVIDAAKTYQAAYLKAKSDADNSKLTDAQRKEAAINRDNFLNLRQTIGGSTEYETK